MASWPMYDWRIGSASRRSKEEAASVKSRAVCIPGIHIHFTIFLTGGKIPVAARGGEGSYKLPREFELASFLAVDFPDHFDVFVSSYKLPPTVRQLSFSELLFFPALAQPFDRGDRQVIV